eukprot:SM009851S25058  [mRNA]  locus=s9851:296:430:+ [translate_table: standard]
MAPPPPPPDAAAAAAAAWNSGGLYVGYAVLGWLAFAVWSASFYPQ